MFQPVAPGQIAERGVPRQNDHPPPAAAQPFLVARVEGFEAAPQAGGVPPVYVASRRVEAREIRRDGVDDARGEDGVEPDMRIESAVIMPVLLHARLFGRRQEIETFGGLQDLGPSSREAVEEARKPGLEPRSHVEEDVAFRKPGQISRAGLPGMDACPGWKEQGGFSPFAGDCGGEIPEGQDAREDAEPSPGRRGRCRPREKGESRRREKGQGRSPTIHRHLPDSNHYMRIGALNPPPFYGIIHVSRKFPVKERIMASTLGGLKPGHLWRYFEEICGIPHCSGNEKALAEHILRIAAGLGLEAKKDKIGNVIVRKPATAGLEKAPGVILQGHMDMVGDKNSDVAHDFAKDPIRPAIKGEWVQADGTTLGADNGIGVAAGLAVMEDKGLVHGPVEFLFTVDEETGLTGANKLEKGVLRGKYLLNLDSEEEGTFTIGCAGGADSIVTLPLKRKAAASKNLYVLKVAGLRGGHSGLDIHQGRANAIKLVARLLLDASAKHRFDLVGIEGGNKRNAIPREAWAVLAVEPARARALGAFIKKAFEDVRTEVLAVETGAKVSFEKAEPGKQLPMTAASRDALLRMLVALPHGVISMHPEIAGLTETSTNLAIIHCDRKQAQVICSTRSSIRSSLEATRGALKAVCDLAGARIQLNDGYPGWMPDLRSTLLAKLKEIYKSTAGKEPGVVAVHAGLECGIIGEKYPGMEMISFGPTLEHPHSPDERVHIASVERFWEFVKAALAGLAS